MIVSKWKTENRCRFRYKWRELDYKLYKVLLGIVWFPIEMQMGIVCYFQTPKKNENSINIKQHRAYYILIYSFHNPLLFSASSTDPTHTNTSTYNTILVPVWLHSFEIDITKIDSKTNNWTLHFIQTNLNNI